MTTRARRGHHKMGGVWVKNSPRVCRRVFLFEELAAFWQREVEKAPMGESISKHNSVGTRLHINKADDRLTVVPVSKGQTYVNSEFEIVI